MNFQAVNGSTLIENGTVTFSATIERFIGSDRSGVMRVVLKDVKVDGKPFRDHVWVKPNKQLENLGAKEGDMIEGTAKLYEYQDINDANKRKVGLKKLRSLTVTEQV